MINNSYARARSAFTARDVKGYQNLAKIQADLGVQYLTLNLDGTARIQVKMEEMLAFLPDVIPAIQEVTNVPISFDNPSIKYHEVALKHYDRKKSGTPILNSIAASRTRSWAFISSSCRSIASGEAGWPSRYEMLPTWQSAVD